MLSKWAVRVNKRSITILICTLAVRFIPLFVIRGHRYSWERNAVLQQTNVACMTADEIQLSTGYVAQSAVFAFRTTWP